jgi:hypothetical protein
MDMIVRSFSREFSAQTTYWVQSGYVVLIVWMVPTLIEAAAKPHAPRKALDAMLALENING